MSELHYIETDLGEVDETLERHPDWSTDIPAGFEDLLGKWAAFLDQHGD